MSGPKISVYSLTGRSREIVTGQMRCEQKSLACYARTKEIIMNLQPLCGNLDTRIRNIELLMKRTSEGAEQVVQLQTIQKEVKEEAAGIKRELAAGTPHASAKYLITEEALTEKQAELKRLQTLQERAEKLKTRLESVFSQDQKNTSKVKASSIHDLEDPDTGRTEETGTGLLQHDDAHVIQKIQAGIIDDISGIFSFEFDEEIPDTDFQDEKENVSRELSALLYDRSLPESILNEIKKAILSLQKIEELQYLRNFCSVTVKRILQKISTYRYEEAQKEAEYKELFARYEALCSMAGEEARQLPYSEAAAAEISAEICRIEILLVRQQEQAYISECVDEVMADMGYDLIGSRDVRKKSGKRFKNELFTFNEGTAVNVTYSSDGQISMELGGLAREDRIPTADEMEILTHDMESFCGEFEEFERRMLARGVIVGNRIAMLPPSAEYTSIINVNDYDVSESAQISVMNVAEKRRRQTEKKIMRRSE